MAYGFESMHPDLARLQKLRNRKTLEGGTVVRYPSDSPSFALLLKIIVFDINRHIVDALYRRNLLNPFLYAIQGSNGSTPLVLIGLEKWLVSTTNILSSWFPNNFSSFISGGTSQR